MTKPNLENLQKAAHAISKRALENGFDPHYMSPFARSARRSLGINITGGKPDDVTVLLAVVVITVKMTQSQPSTSISEAFIEDCRLTLGQWDAGNIETLGLLFKDQSSCPQLYNNDALRKEFQSLLDFDLNKHNDTPMMRITLSVMIRFKHVHLCADDFYRQIYLRSSTPPSSNTRLFSIQQELSDAYCFLLAQVDNELTDPMLRNLQFYYAIQQPSIDSLLTLYNVLSRQNCPYTLEHFFNDFGNCYYVTKSLIKIYQLVENFKIFIKKYNKFLEMYQNDKLGITETNDRETLISTTAAQDNHEKLKNNIPKIQPVPNPVPVQNNLSLQQSQTIIPKQGLCVIINIVNFSSNVYETTKRAGSEKDVALVDSIFNAMNFTILICEKDFTKDDLDKAMHQIKTSEKYKRYDCLVLFIMSHGLLHTVFTADAQTVYVRDLIMDFNDSSKTSIWNGKTRFFFIQACRSVPQNNKTSNMSYNITDKHLSPNMLVAFSCSEEESSKRNPNIGSIYIHILCIMFYMYSKIKPVDKILELTAEYLKRANEKLVELYPGEKAHRLDQHPKYVSSLRDSVYFSERCLVRRIQYLTDFNYASLKIPLALWTEVDHYVKTKLIYDTKPNHHSDYCTECRSHKG
ncbi:unnamed protein product [Didymodactylos carnosus]|uniref:Caspase-8 n=1 Tax=Didymodactylos carnosus TaxID=1234261 RepID=A0A8S2ITT5_9BILA|nr:unnamed protein product [Didymodactylos carnosus]CAF3767823.1 unnamed protein product [Didymodactylos carnosus]